MKKIFISLSLVTVLIFSAFVSNIQNKELFEYNIEENFELAQHISIGVNTEANSLEYGDITDIDPYEFSYGWVEVSKMHSETDKLPPDNEIIHDYVFGENINNDIYVLKTYMDVRDELLENLNLSDSEYEDLKIKFINYENDFFKNEIEYLSNSKWKKAYIKL